MIYLLAQIFLCLLIAFLLGLFLGWLIWDWADDDAEELREARKQIAALDADLAACRRAATVTPAPEAPVMPVVAPVAEVAPAETVVPTAPMALFGPAADAAVDDLKVISGIGPVIEKQLAGIGITTYRQIALLTPEDVVRVQEAIDFFPGRIEREEWVDQADRLHRDTYGEAP